MQKTKTNKRKVKIRRWAHKYITTNSIIPFVKTWGTDGSSLGYNSPLTIEKERQDEHTVEWEIIIEVRRVDSNAKKPSIIEKQVL